MLTFNVWSVIIVYSQIKVLLCIQQRTVQTRIGPITGQVKSVHYSDTISYITTFLGVPYAEPPIGSRRFNRPVAKNKFSAPYSAFDFGASCPQNLEFNQPKIISEDCLYLNVFTPVVSSFESHFPVIIWIHGGGFVGGDSSSYGGERITAFGQVVLVTINYRLGPLGFFSLGDSDSKPNNGLYDQHLAIKWVHENIQSFGGDPRNVTLSGQSAGAASVIFQSLFKGNDGLFHRMIVQSGSALDKWAVTQNPAKESKVYASRLGCNGNKTLDVLKCLQGISNITRLSSVASSFLWTPSVDNIFIEKETMDAFFEPNRTATINGFRNRDLLMGTNGFDGQFVFVSTLKRTVYETFKNKYASLAIIVQLTKYVLQECLKDIFGAKLLPQLLPKVLSIYKNTEHSQDRNYHIKECVDFMTDFMFLQNTYRTIASHSYENKQYRTYQYVFNEKPNYPKAPKDPWVTGASHGDELMYTFGFTKGLDNFFGYDEETYKRNWHFTSVIMNYWTNFAKTGNPNGPGLPDWKPYTTQSKDYMYLTSFRIASRTNLHSKGMEFWTSYVPSVTKSYVPSVTKYFPPNSSETATQPIYSTGLRFKANAVDITLCALSVIILGKDLG